MPKKPDGLCGKNHLDVPDAMTITAFVKQARQVWHAAHPNRRQGGRSLVESDLALAAQALVCKELKAKPGIQLFSKETRKRMIHQLARQFVDFEESTIRRQVELSLIDAKSLPDITEQDKAFLRARRKGEARLIEQAPAIFKELLRGLDRYLQAVQVEFPDQVKAAEQTGKPLTMEEVKRLFVAKKNGQPLTFNMLRHSQSPGPRR